MRLSYHPERWILPICFSILTFNDIYMLFKKLFHVKILFNICVLSILTTIANVSWAKSTKAQLCMINNMRELLLKVGGTINKIILNTGYMLRVDFRCSHQTHKKKWLTTWGNVMLIGLTVAITSLCICISNHQVVHLKYSFLFLKEKKYTQLMFVVHLLKTNSVKAFDMY